MSGAKRQRELLAREWGERAALGDWEGMRRVEPGLFPKGLSEELARAALRQALKGGIEGIGRMAARTGAEEGSSLAPGDFWRVAAEESWRRGADSREAFWLAGGSLDARGWRRADLIGEGLGEADAREAIQRSQEKEKAARAIWRAGMRELRSGLSGRGEAAREQALQAARAAAERLSGREADEALAEAVEMTLARRGDEGRTREALGALRGASWERKAGGRGRKGLGESALERAWGGARTGRPGALEALSAAREALGERFWGEESGRWAKAAARGAGMEDSSRLAGWARESGMPAEWGREILSGRIRGWVHGMAGDLFLEEAPIREAENWAWSLGAGTLNEVAALADPAGSGEAREERSQTGEGAALSWVRRRGWIGGSARDRLEAFEREFARRGWRVPFGSEDLEAAQAPDREKARLQRLLLEGSQPGEAGPGRRPRGI